MVPGRYFPKNRDDKVVEMKTKVVKLEIMNREKKSALQTLVSEVGTIDLSESDLEDQQDLIDEMQLLPPNIADDNVEHRNSPLAVVANMQQPIDTTVGAGIPDANVQQPNGSDAGAGVSGENAQQPSGADSAGVSQLPSASSIGAAQINGVTDDLAGPAYEFRQNVSKTLQLGLISLISFYL